MNAKELYKLTNVTPYFIFCFEGSECQEDPHLQRKDFKGWVWRIWYFSSVQFSHSVVSDSATLWTATGQASLSITNSQSLLKLKSIESVMPFNHLTFCHPLLLLPSIVPRIKVFFNESVLCYQVAKVLQFQLGHQSFRWIFRTDFL